MYSVKQVIKDALSKFWKGYKQNVVDNLTSKNADLPLSANMGRELNSKLNGWKVENYKLEVNSSTGYIAVNKDISLSGYKPVCIANYWLYNTSWYAINKIWIDYATQELSVAGRHINNSQSVEYVIIFVQILYVPV